MYIMASGSVKMLIIPACMNNRDGISWMFFQWKLSNILRITDYAKIFDEAAHRIIVDGITTFWFYKHSLDTFHTNNILQHAFFPALKSAWNASAWNQFKALWTAPKRLKPPKSAFGWGALNRHEPLSSGLKRFQSVSSAFRKALSVSLKRFQAVFRHREFHEKRNMFADGKWSKVFNSHLTESNAVRKSPILS